MNSRNVITRCFDSRKFHSCPVCQYAIGADHDEAIATEAGRNAIAAELVDTELVEVEGPSGFEIK